MLFLNLTKNIYSSNFYLAACPSEHRTETSSILFVSNVLYAPNSIGIPTNHDLSNFKRFCFRALGIIYGYRKSNESFPI